jgi:hypothetical protein
MLTIDIETPTRPVRPMDYEDVRLTLEPRETNPLSINQMAEQYDLDMRQLTDLADALAAGQLIFTGTVTVGVQPYFVTVTSDGEHWLIHFRGRRESDSNQRVIATRPCRSWHFNDEDGPHWGIGGSKFEPACLDVLAQVAQAEIGRAA